MRMATSSGKHPAGDLAPIDFNRLLRENLEHVFNQRDPKLRATAIEPDSIIEGRAAISAIVGKLLDQFGASFAFTPETTGVGHHGMGSMRWHAGNPDNPKMVTGTDTAEVVDGRIARLWVLLDPMACSLRHLADRRPAP